MSLYIRWINLIKEKADETWLTDSQRKVYEAILARWKSAPFVNLYGPPGAGKTFSARLLSKTRGYAYTQDLEQAPRDAEQVIVDDAQYVRMMRPTARLLGLGRVLLVTRNPVDEAMPRIELVLNARDVRQFQATLSDRCGITFVQSIPQSQDLAEIIRQEVIARGETYVHQRP